jgi:hypothetical protein
MLRRGATSRAAVRSGARLAGILSRVETQVRERYERIEAILEAIARRQDRFDKQLQAAAARQDRFDTQLQATAKLVAEGIKIVRTLARDTRELKRSQKAFLDSLRQAGNGRGPGKA